MLLNCIDIVWSTGRLVGGLPIDLALLSSLSWNARITLTITLSGIRSAHVVSVFGTVESGTEEYSEIRPVYGAIHLNSMHLAQLPHSSLLLTIQLGSAQRCAPCACDSYPQNDPALSDSDPGPQTL